jgi:hypothetical protein
MPTTIGSDGATRATVAAFGAVAGLAGIEHGIGEVLQGNTPPSGSVIASWPDTDAFDVLGGEPAMTVVPNLLVTGILAVLASSAFLLWSTVFVRRRNSGVGLIVIAVVMLLVGAGFGPPLLGLVVGAAATRMGAPPRRPHSWHVSRTGRILAQLWPWFLGCGILAFLLLVPGIVVFSALVGPFSPGLLVPVLTFTALAMMLLAIVSGRARDVALATTGPRAARRSAARRGHGRGSARQRR